MNQCEKCRKCFRDSYNLKKHMSRIKPCIEEIKDKNNENIPKSTLITAKQSSVTANQSSATENQSSATENQSLVTENQSSSTENQIKCDFCLNTFARKYNLKIHQENCKFKNDPVRLLEIENGVKPCLASLKTECRFCNLTFHNTSNLNKHIIHCKKREEYHNELLKTKESTGKFTQINNINNFNAPVNNITINLIGNEDTSHIDIQKIINNLRELNSNYGNNHLYLQAGEMVISYDDLLREVPENQNMYLPNDRSLYAEVKTEDGWEKKEREQTLNECFKNSAKLLYDSKESIESANKKVFARKSTNKVFDEVKQFSEKGFKHEHATGESIYSEDQKTIKSKFKIGRLKNRITN
jgi:hypothetical protein